MAYLCPVFPLGPPMSGIYTYYAIICPGAQPSQLMSSYSRTCGGCAPDGGPGPDCDALPPPPTAANAGGPARRGKTLILESLGIDEDLVNRGMSRKLEWKDSLSENGSIHAMTCRMWDDHHRIWRTCRLFLHFAAPKTPAGGTLPPMFFGSGYELSEETIPAEARSEIIDLSQSCLSRLGNHLLRAKVGGIDYYALTAG